MLAIFGEDRSDFETLRTIVRVLRRDPSLKVAGKGYRGCGNLLNDCARDIGVYYDQGCRKFLVCHDADGKELQKVRQAVMDRVIRPIRLTVEENCIIIPVQEIESWILADLSSIKHIFKNWIPSEIANPENVSSPKEHLEKLSRDDKFKPRYNHSTHNSQIAKYLNYTLVASKCPSFRPLVKFLSD